MIEDSQSHVNMMLMVRLARVSVCGLPRAINISTMLMLTGLFHGVISESGVATAPYSVHNPSDGTVDFHDYMMSVGKLFDCGHHSDMHALIECLKLVPYQDIVDKRHEVFKQ